MKAEINGIKVEGTPEEIAQVINLVATIKIAYIPSIPSIPSMPSWPTYPAYPQYPVTYSNSATTAKAQVYKHLGPVSIARPGLN